LLSGIGLQASGSYLLCCLFKLSHTFIPDTKKVGLLSVVSHFYAIGFHLLPVEELVARTRVIIRPELTEASVGSLGEKGAVKKRSAL